MVPATNAAREYETIADRLRMPAARSIASVAIPANVGNANWRFKLATEARRQAIKGPMPVSSNNNKPSGILTALKNGGPTVILEPRTASDRIGNSVPQRTENAMPTNNKLL